MTLFHPDVRLAIGVLTLIALTGLVLRSAQVPLGWGPAWAVIRGAGQLVLVTLPGAFIGALLGGADPMDAARFQLVVLVALINAQAIAGVIITYRLGAPAQLPRPAG